MRTHAHTRLSLPLSISSLARRLEHLVINGKVGGIVIGGVVLVIGGSVRIIVVVVTGVKSGNMETPSFS